MAIVYHGFRNGFAIEIVIDRELTVNAEKMRADLDAIERQLRAIGVEGFSTPTEKPVKAASKKAEKVSEEPVYDEDGTPICPRHNKPMTEGPFGFYCRTKCDSSEPKEWKNSKGYCNYKAE